MSQHSDRIAPHGGTLVNRIATLDQRQEFFDKAEVLPRVQLSDRSISDLQNDRHRRPESPQRIHERS